MEYKTFSISENHYLLQIGYFDTQVTIWNMVIICMDFSGVHNDGIVGIIILNELGLRK